MLHRVDVLIISLPLTDYNLFQRPVTCQCSAEIADQKMQLLFYKYHIISDGAPECDFSIATREHKIGRQGKGTKQRKAQWHAAVCKIDVNVMKNAVNVFPAVNFGSEYVRAL